MPRSFDFLRLTFLALLFPLLPSLPLASAATPSPAPLPNIVLLMGDDHGWDETGYNGHPHLKTPVLDEIARTGLRLDRFYSGGSSCSPTRGTVITGRHHLRYGIFNPGYSLRPEEISIAQLLRARGYATGHFGKWHLGPVKAASPTNPRAMGFDEYLSHDNFFELDPWLSRNGAAPEQFKGESSEIIVAEAQRFIDRAKRENRPFFVVIWFGSPHEPYQALPRDLALYDNLPADFATKRVRLTSNETGRTVQRVQRDVLRERYAEITAMDRSIGQLRDHLRRANLRDNTLLWYCGDNGTPTEGNATVPFRGEKAHIYEGGIRVPGVIEWPARIKQPLVSDVTTVTNDILPTLCALTGAPLPKRPLDGINLEPVFAGTLRERPNPLCFWNGRARAANVGRGEPYIDPELQKGTTPLVKLGPDGTPTRNFQNYRQPDIRDSDFAGPRAIIHRNYKLVLAGAANSDAELFDLHADPAEKNNIIAQHPELATQLREQLHGWQRSVLQSLTGADYR